MAAWAFLVHIALFLVIQIAPAASQAMSAIAAPMSPIKKVVTLIEEMKQQVEKDAEDDTAAYDKYMCWCDTNRKEKTAAIKNAEEQIEELTAFVEEAAAKESELKTEIATLEDDIADDEAALTTATAVREREQSEFQAEEADLKETRSLLDQAIQVLSKVQLVQRQGKAGAADVNTVKTVLLQIRQAASKRPGSFQGVLQKDLFDVLGALQEVTGEGSAGSSFGETFLPRRGATALDQRDAQPNGLSGAAAGAKSYNSRSGQIVGMLSEMHDEVTRDLSAAQKEEFQAVVAFQKLRAAKLSEIEAAKKLKVEKESQLAELLDKSAKAKEDIAALNEALSADQEFLANLEKNCKAEDEAYAARVKVRSEEIVALGETLKILTADESRDLFDKTISFLQVSSSERKSGEAEQLQAESRLSERAMQRIAEVARRHHNWALVSLAVRVRLDKFTKVKEVMDKMLAELQKQQKEEYAKWEFCKKSIDETEDAIKEGENTKEDLDEKHTDLVNTIETLSTSIDELKKEVADMEVSLKKAGEDRKEENELFQTSVSDQRVAINILQKAQTRLKAFYEQKSLVQMHTASRQVPGAAAPPPPASPKDYEKSAAAGGVLQLIAKIITDAEVTEKELEKDEQKSQEDYSAFVVSTKESIEADSAAIEEKESQKASAESQKAETEEAQLANKVELEKLGELLKAHHLDCDFVLKFFDLRQKSRAEEMDAIKDAKAILSGANFGK